MKTPGRGDDNARETVGTVDRVPPLQPGDPGDGHGEDHHDADDVELAAISSDGDEVRAILLLGGGAPLMAESAHTELPEPDNADALAYMKRRIDALRHAPSANPLDPETHADSTYSEPDLTQS